MKQRQYHMTPSGVRIPHHKTKWMSPPDKKSFEKCHKAKHKESVVLNLNLTYNLHSHAARIPKLPECIPIEVEKWEECATSNV